MTKTELIKKLSEYLADIKITPPFDGRSQIIKDMKQLVAVVNSHKTGPNFHRYILNEADAVYTRFKIAYRHAFPPEKSETGKNDLFAK